MTENIWSVILLKLVSYNCIFIQYFVLIYYILYYHLTHIMYIVHVGKCAGGSIIKFFNKHHQTNIPTLHIFDSRKRIKNIIENEDLILLLRDPIKRIISVFYYWKEQYDKKIIDKKGRMFYKNVYFETFNTVNEFAEGLSSNDVHKRSIALDIVNNLMHIKKSLSYYMCDVNTVNKIANNIKYVITQENFDADFNKFYTHYCKINNLTKHDFTKYKIHNSNKYNELKKLSSIGLQNLMNLDNVREDYAIINILKIKGLVNHNYLS